MIEQGTPEWFEVRLGHATASRASDILAKIKSGEASDRRNYRRQLLSERQTGVYVPGFTNKAMEHGTEKEPYARTAYEVTRNVMLTQVGFTKHAEIQWVGASLDSYLDDEGHIEIKCPNTSTHIDTVLGGMGTKYIPQIQFQLWVRGPRAKWCDYISFDDRLIPKDLIGIPFDELPRKVVKKVLYVKRVERDDGFINEILAPEVIKFLSEVEIEFNQLENLPD
jgi:putative phage-type endonuclease